MNAAVPSRRTLLGVAALAGAAALTSCARSGSSSPNSAGKASTSAPRSATGAPGTGQDPLEDGPPADTAISARSTPKAWRYTHLANTWDGSYQALAATSPDDVWALGAKGGLKDGKRPTALFLDHWDGKRWNSHPLPDEVTPEGMPWALAAGGPDDIWLASRPADASVPSAYHWNGEMWQALPAPPVAKGQLSWGGGVDGPWLAAAGPRHLWLCVDGKTPHWDGESWHLPELPFSARSITAVRPATPDGTPQAWVVGCEGSVAGNCGADPCYPQPASARWTSGGWQRLATPTYRFPEPVPPEASAQLDTVVYDAERARLWTLGSNDFAQGEVDDEPVPQTIVLTGAGNSWTKRQLPDTGRGVGTSTTVPDGTGSLLLDSQSRLTGDGRIVRLGFPADVPGPPEQSSSPAAKSAAPSSTSPSPPASKQQPGQSMDCVATCLVPGTRTVLAAGAVRVFLPDGGRQPLRPMLARYDAVEDA